jgi:hypothetical protein
MGRHHVQHLEKQDQADHHKQRALEIGLGLYAAQPGQLSLPFCFVRHREMLLL